MPSRNLPPPPSPDAGIDGTTTGTFVVDEVLYAARRQRPLVSIVLPAYGEAAILHDHVVELLEYLKTLNRGYRFEIIIVNDGSRDQTGAIATQLAAEFDG